MNNKIGIAFITCNREQLLQKSLDSLDASITENVVIVNDGKKFENIQTKYPIIQHETNLSVCVTKNDAMKYLLEKNCDYIFLIEDDVKIINNEVFNKYIEASNVSNIQHLMFGYSGFANLENGNPKPKLVINYGTCKIALNHHCVGSFAMYTRKCLEKAGLMDENLNMNCFEHCLSGETEVITKYGTKKIIDIVGKKVKIMSSGGKWVSTVFNNYGKQKLLKITLKKYSRIKEVYVTSGHRWFKLIGKGNYDYVEKTTFELKIGDKLKSIYGSGINTRLELSPFGIARGIVVGDGHVDRGMAMICLYGEKKELYKYFSLCNFTKCHDDGIKVSGMPSYFKLKYPSLREHNSYLLGWLAGYFSVDGNVADNGSCSISSVNENNILFVRDVCNVLGIGVGKISERITTNSYNPGTKVYHISFIKKTLNESFFIRKKHLDQYLSVSSEQELANWTVENVEETDRIEDVYCCTVPKHGSFVLEGNLLTGNCLHTHEIYKHGMHPPFWYFADIFESDKYLEDMDRNFSSSSIRKSNKWIQNMQKSVKYFSEKVGKTPMQIEHVDASKVAEELKLIKKTIF